MRHPLPIAPAGPSERHARLADHVWRGAGWDLALHLAADGTGRVARSRTQGETRELWHHRWPGGAALDRTLFTVDETTFVEADRRRTRGGPNLHEAPIVLPARLTVGEPVAAGGGTVTLLHAGPVRAGGVAARGVCLEARQGGEVRHQWLLEGVGEVALGPPSGAWDRWLVRWTGGGRSLFGEMPAEIVAMRWPDLPGEGAAPLQDGLW